MKTPVLYRFSQLVGLALGARFFSTFFLAFALYVSAYFLFNQEENLKNVIFDYKVHGIIICSVLSVLAGGIINQFYDEEKDSITRPFRSKLQHFLKQKYFLTVYIILNIFSLGIACMVSFRVLLFFIIYQFLIWFYSHKLSKILIINNLTFVSLTMYPFFGILIYFQHFSKSILLLAVFLFTALSIIDVLKDILTKNADKIFGYYTTANIFGSQTTKIIASVLLVFLMGISMVIVSRLNLYPIITQYYFYTLFFLIPIAYLIWDHRKSAQFIAVNLLRLWILIGTIFMLINGIAVHLHL